jgi:hypothetical protein
MKLSKLNNKGIRAFQRVLEAARQGEVVITPLALLDDEDLVESLEHSIEFEVMTFETRLQLAGFVNGLLAHKEISDDLNDDGLWAWLGAVFFDSTCPADSDGQRKPGMDYRHIPSSSWRDFYRHLVRGPVRILRLFKDNPEAAAIVLCQNPQSPGDWVEQLASRQERITNPAIIAAANRLYFDPNTRKPKRGAAPNWRKPGTLRRFGDVLDQLDLTYDLYSMSSSDLVSLLPGEFSTYLNDQG